MHQRILSLILFLLAFIASLGQTHECTVEPPKAILRASAVKQGTHHFKRKPPLPDTAPEAVERATLLSGTPVVIEMGGCEHLGEDYRFETPASRAVDCTGWLKEAARQMAAITQAAELPGHTRQYGELLSQRAAQKNPYRCGEELPVMAEVPDYGTVSVSTSSLKNHNVQLQVQISINP